MMAMTNTTSLLEGNLDPQILFLIFIIMKKRKHDKIVKDFERTKEKHLERLADKILEKDEQNQKLREKQINTDFLELF